MSRYNYDPSGTAYSDGRRDGALAERTAIMAWLRKCAQEIHDNQYALHRYEKWNLVWTLANLLERGEHVQPTAALTEHDLADLESLLNHPETKWRKQDE